jgi:transposase
MWLRAHPGVEIMGRDRGGAYADGGRQGAPDAEHVADPWHILANLRETLERLLLREHRYLKQTADALTDAQRQREHEDDTAEEPAVEVEPPASTRHQRQSLARRAHRVERYEEVRRLHAAGASLRQIAEQMQLSRQTVRRFANADTFPERAVRPQYPSIMDEYEVHLRSRWKDGCQNATQLWRELRTMGFTGSCSNVRDRLARWRSLPAPCGRPARAIRITLSFTGGRSSVATPRKLAARPFAR